MQSICYYHHLVLSYQYLHSIDGHKTGVEYKSGVAVAAAEKNLPNASNCNPKDIPNDQLICAY